MDDAQDLEAQGEPDGSVAWAGFQTAGRGRHPGRVWKGNPGESLLFTVYWKPDRFRVPEFAPSLTVGLGVCLWLESLGIDRVPVSLKWPNDVYLADTKVAGILVRQSWGSQGPGSIHAGIGVNLTTPAGPGFRTPPGSLAQFGVAIAPEDALASLLASLALALDHFSPQTACEQRLWRLNQPMTLSVPGRETVPQSGIVRGLDTRGRLRWEGPAGVELVSSGE